MDKGTSTATMGIDDFISIDDETGTISIDTTGVSSSALIKPGFR